MKTIFLSLLLAFSLVLMPTLPAQAAKQSTHSGISKQRAVNIAQSVSSGRVLAVKRRGDVYRVKQLSERGDVRIIVIDAISGKVISGR